LANVGRLRKTNIHPLNNIAGASCHSILAKAHPKKNSAAHLCCFLYFVLKP